MSDEPEMYRHERPQSDAQIAVRWHGLALFALLTASVPVVHLLWHVVTGHDEPVLLTRSQRPIPAFSQKGFREGSWMQGLELSLREASPIVWFLRGVWNEARFAAGVFQSSTIYVSEGNWMFSRKTLHPDLKQFNAAEGARAEFLAEVKGRAESLGLEIVVTIVPDKARVHPEHAYDGGQMPADKAALYPRMLAEFAAAGFEVVDIAAALAAAQAVAPLQPLYYERDTHWRPEAALAAATATTQVLRAACGDLLGPPETFQLGGKSRVRALPDIVASGGFLAFELDVGEELRRAYPSGPVTASLMEEKHYYGVIGWDEREPLGDERVLMAGTSFAGENGQRALVLASGWRMHCVSSPGADGLEPLKKAFETAEERPGQFKVIVWEIVERGFLNGRWLQPRL